MNSMSTHSSTSTENMPLIKNWGIDILDEYTNKAIVGDVYYSYKFADGKHINTSNIKNMYLTENYLIPNIIVETINNSKYLLGNPTIIFKDYMKFLINENSLCSNEYSVETSEGLINCIKFYLSKL